ncbi:GNAT family N-acetyltransferase [Paenibacillus sp. UNC499MF]|uniref:GNAT family N-acetyltransferase n=1 Tax=Paenibacillus sp. UNC499MF TaxID=1502751 RepID=UPI00089FBDE6|nr:GNAT family N-acetyltransferase [Paenibacillus sp. UNC499MF]SEG75049.1 Ribosomal protein S18 acetylase RimI [Paenibacillus sp. UNC499MF]
MDIRIRELTADDEFRSIEVDGSFVVDSVLALTLENGRIGYTVTEVPRYIKNYADEPDGETEDSGYAGHIGNPDKVMYLACSGNRLIGQISLRKNWNAYTYVEDIKIDPAYRRYGVGRKLIDQARQWAKAGGMPGIMLETQNNNVRACKFYESCGFVLGGFDSCLYKGLDKQSQEVALYWYLMLD